MRRAVDDEVPGAVEEETGLATAHALPVHALGALGIVVVVRDVDPRQVAGGDVEDAAHVPPTSPRTRPSRRPAPGPRCTS